MISKYYPLAAVLLFTSVDAKADTIRLDLHNSSFNASLTLSGDTINSTASSYQSSQLANYDATLDFNYGVGNATFSVNDGNFYFRESTQNTGHYLVGWTEVNLNLTNIATGEDWRYIYSFDVFPGNVDDDYMILTNMTTGASYSDWYAPFYWTKTTVVPIPPSLLLFLSGLGAVGITIRSIGRKKHRAY